MLSRLKILLIVPIFIFFTCGCSNKNSVFDYREHSATFSVVFSSDFSGGTSTADVICIGEKSSNQITLTIISPERSSGIKVLYDFSSLSVSVSDLTIPISDGAGENIKMFFDLLYPSFDQAGHSSVGSWTVAKSDDGVHTYLISPLGKVVLDENLLPISVSLKNDNKSVTIREYAIVPQK